MAENDEDKAMDQAAEKVAFLWGVGLDVRGSVAMQLAETRLLIAKLKAHEAELESWARSGDFKLAVPGEAVSAVVNSDGTVLVVHSSEQS